MKKGIARVKRNYEFSHEAAAALDEIKKYSDVTLNDFVSEAVLHYAKHLAEVNTVEQAESPNSPMNHQVSELQEHLYALHYEFLKDRMGKGGIKKAQDYFATRQPIHADQLATVLGDIGKALGKHAPQSVQECKVLLHMMQRDHEAAKQ